MLIEIAYAAETAQGPIATLGIDLKLFLAQLVNFLVVFVVLWKWMYTPLVKKMNERTGKIEKGLKDAHDVAAKLRGAEDEAKSLIAASKGQAQVLLSDAKKMAEEQWRKAQEETQARTGQLVNEARVQIQNEKEKMVREAKQEVAELVVAATEKILQGIVTEKVDKILVEKTLESMQEIPVVISVNAGSQTKPRE